MWIHPFCYDGVKLSTVSNCPSVKLSKCQIVLFCIGDVKLFFFFVMMVSNCPMCQIFLCVKLSYVSNCLRCQILLGVKLSYHNILKLNFGQDSEAEVRSEILKLNFGQVFKTEVWSRLWGWRLVELVRLKFGQDYEAEFWKTCNMT